MKVVEKVWGTEQWIINTDKYCGKRMTLKKGMQCSLHFHTIKDETFYVLTGKIYFEMGVGDDTEAQILRPGDVVRIMPLTVHRFGGMEDSTFIEISTHHDDADVVRHVQSGPMP